MFGKEGATGKTPCHICPVPRYRILSPRNRQAFQFWEELSQTGRDLGFIFGMHVYLKDLQLLSRVWSMSQVKVKCQINENFVCLT